MSNRGAFFAGSREPPSPAHSDSTLSACSSMESLVAVGDLEPGPGVGQSVSVASGSSDSMSVVNQPVFRLKQQGSTSSGQAAAGLSPMSEIAINLQDASLDTPKTGRAAAVGRERSLGKAISSDFKSMLEAGESNNGQLGRLPSAGQVSDDGEIQEEVDDKQDDEDDDNANDDPDKRHIPVTSPLNTLSTSLLNRRMEQRPPQRRLKITPLPVDLESIENEISFYHGHSPQISPRPCSPCECPEDVGLELLPSEVTPSKQRITTTVSLDEPESSNMKSRRSLEHYDSNSMDSGYVSVSSESIKSQSQVRSLQSSAPFRTSTAVSPAAMSMRIFPTLSSDSAESLDDAELELLEMETSDNDSQLLPSNLNSLICGDIKTIKTSPEIKRPAFRRSLSLAENSRAAQANSNSSGSPALDAYRCFKRPEPPGISPIQSKRYKTETQLTPTSSLRTVEPSPLASCPSPLTVPKAKRPILQKSISMNDAHIMSALSRSSTEPDLIGDFSRSYVLPLTEGRHRDLKSITPSIMAEVLRGSYDHEIATFKIIDCRYPYEFEGGHIRGAKNLYTQEQILEELIKSKTELAQVDSHGPKRHIIVFHCEFSSERGPKLSRFLRNHDRTLNSDAYPALHYPEIYLLHGGYKDFFTLHPDLCDPVAYRPMLDPKFGDAYRHFRAKSRSWQGGDVVKVGGSDGGGPSSSGTGITGGTRLVKSRSRLVL